MKTVFLRIYDPSSLLLPTVIPTSSKVSWALLPPQDMSVAHLHVHLLLMYHETNLHHHLHHNAFNFPRPPRLFFFQVLLWSVLSLTSRCPSVLFPYLGKGSKQVMKLVQSCVYQSRSCFKRGMLPLLSFLGWYLESHFMRVEENWYSWDFLPYVKFSRKRLMSSKLLAVASSVRKTNIAPLFSLRKPNSEGKQNKQTSHMPATNIHDTAFALALDELCLLHGKNSLLLWRLHVCSSQVHKR